MSRNTPVIVQKKVFAYITHGHRLLVFSHPNSPTAGIQVPAGTMKAGEDPENAVMREAFEETGLTDLTLCDYLGLCDFDVPGRDEVHRRRFYHLRCNNSPPEIWRHGETSGGMHAPIVFELFWVPLPFGVPALAPGHDAMLSRLIDLLK